MPIDNVMVVLGGAAVVIVGGMFWKAKAGGGVLTDDQQLVVDLNRIRSFYQEDLISRGSTVQLTGTTGLEIEEVYLREAHASFLRVSSSTLPAPIQPKDSSDLERIRVYYINGLRYRGWDGIWIAGSTTDRVYQNYLALFKTLRDTKAISGTHMNVLPLHIRPTRDMILV